MGWGCNIWSTDSTEAMGLRSVVARSMMWGAPPAHGFSHFWLPCLNHCSADTFGSSYSWDQSPLTPLRSQSMETRTLCIKKCILGDCSDPSDFSQIFPLTLCFINFSSSFQTSVLLWMLLLLILHFFRVSIIFSITIFTHCLCLLLFSQITISVNGALLPVAFHA